MNKNIEAGRLEEIREERKEDLVQTNDRFTAPLPPNLWLLMKNLQLQSISAADKRTAKEVQ